MPRTSGVMSLPAGNPVTANTPISSTWANSTLADIASEITNSLPRDGSAPMTQALKLADGASSAPSLTFNGDAATGIFKPTNGTLAISTNGVEKARIDSTGNLSVVSGNIYLNPNSAVGDKRLTVSTAGNNTSSLRFYQTGVSEMWIGQQSGSSGLAFGSGSDYSSEYLRLSTTGNLGVGTTNPTSPIHVYRNSSGSYGNVLIESGASAQFAPSISLSDNRTGQSGRKWSVCSGGEANGSLIFRDDTLAVARMSIDSAGSVQVGNLSPTGASGTRFINISNLENSSIWSASCLSLVTYNNAGTATSSADILKNKGGMFLFNNNEPTTNGYYSFSFNNNEKVRIDANGNVGIGEGNPSAWNSKLVVKGSSGGIQSSVINTGTTVADTASLTTNSGGYSTYISQYGSGYSTIYSNSTTLYLGTVSSAPVSFVTANAERGRITQTGNLGIGTTAPAAKIHSTSSGFNPTNSAVSTNASYIAEGAYGGGYILKDSNYWLGAYSSYGQYNIGIGTASGLVPALTVVSANHTLINPTGVAHGALVINGTHGNSRAITTQNIGINRWMFGATNELEAGSNIGSNFAIDRFNDAGTWLGASMVINRASGVIYTVVENTSSTSRSYNARVWANFDGSGAVGGYQPVRASGGVSSIYKNATGDYTINFLEAQYDAKYALVGTSSGNSNAGAPSNAYILVEHWTSGAPTLKNNAQFRIASIDNNTDSFVDAFSINFAIFR